MTHLRTYVAMTATAAALALGQNAFAQDDLEDLLAGIEADAPAAQPAATEEKTEEAGDPPAEAAPESAEEAVPAEEAVEPAAEEAAAPAAEEAAEPAEEAAPAAEPAADDVDAALDAVSEVSGEEPAEATEEPAAEAPAEAETTEAAPEEGAPATVGAAPGKDSELIDELNTYERLRRQAMDAQAMREIEEARASMVAGEFKEAVRHYGNAFKFLNDRPGSKVFKEECREGIAEGLYQAALEEDRTGRRDAAVKLMNQAVDRRHPKARRQLEAWNSEVDPDKYKMPEVKAYMAPSVAGAMAFAKMLDIDLEKNKTYHVVCRDKEGVFNTLPGETYTIDKPIYARLRGVEKKTKAE